MGGLMAHDLKVGEAIDEINLTSSFLAGLLPGGGSMGSFRNNALAALAELKPDLDARSFKVDYASFRTLSGALNYIQKVGFGVMTDFVTGRMSAMVVPARGASKSAIRNAKDPNIRWIHAQRVQILQLYDYTVEASKSVGEGLSNMVEDYLSPAKADAPDKTGVNKKK